MKKEITPLKELLALVKKADKKQLSFMISDFEMTGFYRENRNQTRGFILNCLKNCYKEERNAYGIYDSDSLDMEKTVLRYTC